MIIIMSHARAAPVVRHRLLVDYMHLSNDERGRIRRAADIPRDLHVTLKRSFRQTTDASTPPCVLPDNATVSVSVPMTMHVLRDIVILIRPLDPAKAYDIEDMDHADLAGGTSGRDTVLLMLLERIDKLERQLAPKSCATRDPLVSLGVRIRCEGHTSWKLHDCAMVRHAIPSQYYGIAENPHLIYFVPFDHSPLDLAPTTTMNAKRVDVGLELHLLPGRYDVHVLTRAMNIIRIQGGMGMLVYV